MDRQMDPSDKGFRIVFFTWLVWYNISTLLDTLGAVGISQLFKSRMNGVKIYPNELLHICVVHWNADIQKENKVIVVETQSWSICTKTNPQPPICICLTHS